MKDFLPYLQSFDIYKFELLCASFCSYLNFNLREVSGSIESNFDFHPLNGSGTTII